MEIFELNTSQNVSLQFPIASVADRILAFFFDSIFMATYVIIVALILVTWFNEFTWEITFFFLPVPFYHLFFELLFNGQTPGKRIMNIRVFKTDGTNLSAGNCFIRWIFRFVDVSITAGALATFVIIINGKGQRLGDIATQTTVLKIRRKNNLQQTLWVDIEKDYQPRFPEAETLSDKDVQIIKEVINVVNDSQRRPDNYVLLLNNTRKAIEQKLNTSSDLTDMDYLTTIIKDYNACHQRPKQ